MEIKIDVDETKFDEVLKDELKALKPEEIHRVLLDCIGEYFRNNNYKAVSNLIFYDGYGDRTETNFTQKVIQSCDYSGLQDVVDEMIKQLTENHKDILSKVLLDAMMGGMVNTYTFQQTLGNAISCAIRNYDKTKNK